MVVEPPTAAVRIAARFAVALFVMMAAFQVLIALRVLPQDIVWGGSHSEATLQLSLASLASALVLCGFATIIHRRATSSESVPVSLSVRTASWVVTIYMLLNTIGNFLSSNMFERYFFGSVTTILFICCCTVSLSSASRSALDSYETVP